MSVVHDSLCVTLDSRHFAPPLPTAVCVCFPGLEALSYCRGDGGSAVNPGVTYLVVVHDRVERLNPHGVYVPVEDNPLGTVVRDVGQVPHDG